MDAPSAVATAAAVASNAKASAFARRVVSGDIVVVPFDARASPALFPSSDAPRVASPALFLEAQRCSACGGLAS